MKKNYRVGIKVEKDLVENIKYEANTLGLTFSDVCRQKLKPNHQLIKIELLLETILKELKKQNDN
jgi:hypothetical protein